MKFYLASRIGLLGAVLIGNLLLTASTAIAQPDEEKEDRRCGERLALLARFVQGQLENAHRQRGTGHFEESARQPRRGTRDEQQQTGIGQPAAQRGHRGCRERGPRGWHEYAQDHCTA